MFGIKPKRRPVVTVHVQTQELQSPRASLALDEGEEPLREARTSPPSADGDPLQVPHGLEVRGTANYVPIDGAYNGGLAIALIVYVAASREAFDDQRRGASKCANAVGGARRHTGHQAQAIGLEHLPASQHHFLSRGPWQSNSGVIGRRHRLKHRALWPQRDLIKHASLVTGPLGVNVLKGEELQQPRGQRVRVQEHGRNLLHDLGRGEGVGLPQGGDARNGLEFKARGVNASGTSRGSHIPSSALSRCACRAHRRTPLKPVFETWHIASGHDVIPRVRGLEKLPKTEPQRHSDHNQEGHDPLELLLAKLPSQYGVVHGLRKERAWLAQVGSSPLGSMALVGSCSGPSRISPHKGALPKHGVDVAVRGRALSGSKKDVENRGRGGRDRGNREWPPPPPDGRASATDAMAARQGAT
mmetsp:Transcript_111148/g.313618  ORF Transcript_111148/g.313618 Transcript_111148/m.313618 type:complete len:415 (-) Transcript_111148:65-1309(-)